MIFRSNFLKRAGTLFLVGVGLCFLAFLTSCENFLKGANIRDDLAEAIEIANSTPMTINVMVDEGAGTVTPTQLKLKKLEKFEIEYKPAESYRFIEWEVLDAQANYLPMPYGINFDNKTAAKTTGQLLLKPHKSYNLVIHPKTVKVPSIVSVKPDSSNSASSNFANTPIIVQFNMPLENCDLTSFNFDNISITCNGESVTNCFNLPVFSSDKKTLTIAPKVSKLIEYITNKNSSVIEVQVSFSEALYVWDKDLQLQVHLEQNEKSSFLVRYNLNKENNIPSADRFVVTNEPVTLDTINSLSLEKQFSIKQNLTTDEEILKNRSNGAVYIYGEYTDEESGIGSVKVVEKRTNRKDGSPVNEGNGSEEIYLFDSSVSYNTANCFLEFETTENTTRFLLKYETMRHGYTGSNKDGAINLEVSVYDNSGNEATPKKLTVIRDSFMDMTNVVLYNFEESPYPPSEEAATTGDYLTTWYNYPDHSPGLNCVFKDDFYEQNLKVVKLRPLHKLVYKNTYLSEDEFNISVQYSGHTDNLVYNQNKSKWEISQPLQVSTVADLGIKLIINDSNGSTYEKEFCYPPDPECQIKTVTNPGGWQYPGGYLILRSGLSITAYTKFNEYTWSNEYSRPVTYAFEWKKQLIDGYSSCHEDGAVVGSIFIYQNGSLWGNISPWFINPDEEIDNTMTPPVLSTMNKRRCSQEGFIEIVATIPADTWDTYDYDFIRIYKGEIDPRSYNTDEKIRQRLNSFANIAGVFEQGQTSIVLKEEMLKDFSNRNIYYVLRGVKNGKMSELSNHIRVVGVNNEPVDIQTSLLNYKPMLISNVDWYTEIATHGEFHLYGVHHGTDGDNTIYYKGVPDCTGYFYPVSITLPYTEACGYNGAYTFDTFEGSQVFVTINGVTNTYNFNDVTFKYDENNYFSDSSYDEDKFEYNYQLVVPLEEMCNEYNDLEIKVTTNCGTSETYNTTWERKYVPKFNNFTGSYLRSEQTEKTDTDYQAGEWNFIINRYNTSSKKWTNNKNFHVDPEYNASQKDFYVSDITISSLPSSSYIQVIAQAVIKHEDNSYWDSHYSDVVYHWTGTKSKRDEYDYMIGQNDFWLIASDQPVLVHTLVTKVGYDTCQAWDAATWERNHTVVSEKQLTFSTSNNGAKKYKPDTSSLVAGDCYVVIAHFADDHIEISEVKQK